MTISDRTQVNIRLERELLDELDEMASVESVDRTELARRLLRDGLKRERVALAMRRHRAGEVSVGRAAEEAGISLYEMLDRIHDEGTPYELDSDELDRVDALIGERPPASVREHAGSYWVPRPDAASGIDELRAQFRPPQVTWLFVGESSPAGGTHFYRANSILFRAMREAFARAFGKEVPSGPAFLHFFCNGGAWLVDLADRPVNRLSDRERTSAVASGIESLAALVKATRPERIFVVKASIALAVHQAAEAVGFDGDVIELPFPARQWRAVFVRKLATALVSDRHSPTNRPRPVRDGSSRSRGQTQRITQADIAAGQIRMPKRTKALLPEQRTSVRIDLRGHKQTSRYDPHYDADRERSGVLSVDRAALSRLVEPNERLDVSVLPDGTIHLE